MKWWSNNAYDNVTASPSSVSYTNQMSPSLLFTLGQFYLTADWWISGNIVVNLAVSGDVGKEYYTQWTTVFIVPSVAPLPSPYLLSAEFGDNGASFAIHFDKATDQAGIVANYWPCSRLFTFPGSSYTTCSWTDSLTVTGQFGVLAPTKVYLAPGNCCSLGLDLLCTFFRLFLTIVDLDFLISWI